MDYVELLYLIYSVVSVQTQETWLYYNGIQKKEYLSPNSYKCIAGLTW